MPADQVPGVQTPAGILDVPNVRLIEPFFADLIETAFTDQLISVQGTDGRLLVDENDDPIAVAIGEGDDFIAGSFHLRSPTARLIERFEETAGIILQEEREVWAASVRAAYSTALMAEVPPAMEDLNPDRPGMIHDLLRMLLPPGGGAACLDCCCGSGVGSGVLRSLGYHPVSYDNDPMLLSLGLSRGRLLPEETIWIDATAASRYLKNVPVGIALMAGEFNDFNQEMWEQIITELISLTDWCLVTVGTDREARLVRQWATLRGRVATVSENQRDIMYDRFFCEIRREEKM